jgi:hypothetical protein
VAEVTGCDRILSRLEMGPATAAELYATTYCVVHSRVAQLRDRGYAITCERIPGDGASAYLYTLERGVGDPAVTGYASSPTSSHQLGDPVRPSHKLAEPTLPAAGEKTGVEANAGEPIHPSAPQEFLSPEEESARPAVPPPIRPLAGQLSIEDAA